MSTNDTNGPLLEVTILARDNVKTLAGEKVILPEDMMKGVLFQLEEPFFLSTATFDTIVERLNLSPTDYSFTQFIEAILEEWASSWRELEEDAYGNQ